MPVGLDGVRVVEVGQGVGAPWAARLLADLGADVIKVEPPAGDHARRRGPFPPGADGDAEQSGLFLGLNTNKRSTVLDLDTATGRDELAGLIADADIVVHDLTAAAAARVGLAAEHLLERHPSLVSCAITPFGHTGPHAEWQAEELQIVHGGGWGFLIPGDDPDPDAPPLTVFGSPAQTQAGTAAALACVASLDKARRTGVGEFVDLSAMAHVASMLESAFVAWSHMGEVAMRNEGRILTPWKILPCRDGLIFLVTVEQDQWLRLVELMGNPDWAQLEVFATVAARAENQDVMYIYLEEWTRQFGVDELFHMGQAERICFAPVFTMAQLAEQEHLHARNFFHQVTHPVAGPLVHQGSPFTSTPDRWSVRRPAPRLGEHQGAQFRTPGSQPPSSPTPDPNAVDERPFDGLRVIDFSWVWAGPFCTMHLAYLGADVIKIESSVRPGLGRRLPLHPPEIEPTLNTCGYFNQWDQGKRSLELDLTDPTSIDTVLTLIAGADVVVDNFATGVMARLGLSDETLRRVNPDVILASVTGYGHDGPLASYMGYGPTTAPLSGLAAITGHVGGPPVEAGISFGDPAAGLAAAFAIAAAVFDRRSSGDAQRIDVSLWEATAVTAVEAWMGHSLGAAPIEPMGNRHPQHAPRGVFAAAGDDQWVTLSVTSDSQWKALAPLLGAADDPRFTTATDRKANEDALEALVTFWAAEHDKWELTELLQEIGIAAYPSMPCSELEDAPQLAARGFWVRHDHPETGPRLNSGPSWKLSNAADTVTRRAPLIGEHTAEILREVG